jgi:hypothetical protein
MDKEPLPTVGGNINYCRHYGISSIEIPQKIKNKIPI